MLLYNSRNSLSAADCCPLQVVEMAIIFETINGVVIDDDLMALFGTETAAEEAPGPSPPVALGASGWA